MTKIVKRYDAPKLRVYDAKAQGFCVVEYADYARLEQECERLRADLRFLAEYIAAESAGHPLPNYQAIGRFPVDVARAALSAKP